MKLINLYKYSIYILIFFIIGCNEPNSELKNDTEHVHEVPAIAVTQWTDKMEIFMEYEMPEINKPVKFIIHLTILSNFQPVRSGTVSLNFKDPNGNKFNVSSDKLLREGIFTPKARFLKAGKYDFTIDFEDKDLKETFKINDFIVSKTIPHELLHGKEEVDNKISFLKEQQWKIDFKTEEAKIKKIRPSIQAIAEIIPRKQSHIEIITPVSGVISIKQNKNIPVQGTNIKSGEVLIRLSPPPGSKDSWTEAKILYQQAKKQYQRAKELLQTRSISTREYEKIEKKYLLYNSGFSSYPKQYKESFFTIYSPVNGIVTETPVTLGQIIPRGQKLITIIDNSKVWIKVSLFEKDFYKLNDTYGASIRIPGIDQLISFTKKDFKLISKSPIIDPETKAYMMTFEVDNIKKQLLIGQILNIELYNDIEKEDICIPRRAIYEDNGQKVVFIHSEGEAFEKRVIQTKTTYYEWVSITGLKKGERVVTKGGYLV